MQGEGKYAKYILDTTPEPPNHFRPADPKERGGTNVIYINNELEGAMPGAHYMDVALITKPFGLESFQQHAHSFDEYVTFIGTNIDKPYDLDGTIEFWIEDEKYILTKTCTILIPKGVYHLPFRFHEVNSPIIFMASAETTHYVDARGPIDPPPAGFGVL
jgi:hypothetical protein